MTIKTHSLHEISFAFFVQNHGHFSRFLTCCFEKKMYNSIRDLGERQRHRRLPVHRSQGKCTAERNKQAVRESAGRRGTEMAPPIEWIERQTVHRRRFSGRKVEKQCHTIIF